MSVYGVCFIYMLCDWLAVLSSFPASNSRLAIHEDFEESFLGFEESSVPEFVHESVTSDCAFESVRRTYIITETIVQTEITTAPIFETSLPGIILTSEGNDTIDNIMDIQPPVTGG